MSNATLPPLGIVVCWGGLWCVEVWSVGLWGVGVWVLGLWCVRCDVWGCGVWGCAPPPPPPKSTIKFVSKPRSMQPPHTPKAPLRKSPAPPGT